jgi:hypothetical protein
MLKYGQTSQEAAGANLYYDYGVRVAKAFSIILLLKLTLLL